MAENAYLEKFYEWRQAQALTLGAACFSLAGLILSPLLAAMFDPKANVRLWHVLVLLSASFLAVLSGAIWHMRARRLQREFLREQGPELLTW